MFKDVRPRYVIKQYQGRKFPQKPRTDISVEDIIHKFNSEKIVDKSTKIATIGSCFAERLKDWLIGNNYNVQDGDWNKVYNPRNIKQIIQLALEPDTFSCYEEFWVFDGDYRHPYIKGRAQPYPLPNNPKQARDAMKLLHASYTSIFKDIEVLIITLGQTEYWAHKSQPKVPFYAAPFVGIKEGDSNHICGDLTLEEIKFELNEIVRLLTKYNPKIKILFSISPIPLVATVSNDLSAYISAGFSKSKLHSSTLEFIQNKSNLYYMPSFEMVNSHPYTSFEEDGRHVPQHIADIIMETFKYLYVKGNE
jgi:hypothetical protein